MMAYDILGDYGAFQSDLPSLLRNHRGEVVVYHDKTQVGVFETFEDAARFGVERYELGNFIVQKIEPQTPSRISYSLMV